MNISKKIKNWFWNTKSGLQLQINELSGAAYGLRLEVDKLEQDLWKAEKFKEDYRTRLTRYYDECIELKKEIKKLKKKKPSKIVKEMMALNTVIKIINRMSEKEQQEFFQKMAKKIKVKE